MTPGRDVLPTPEHLTESAVERLETVSKESNFLSLEAVLTLGHAAVIRALIVARRAQGGGFRGTRRSPTPVSVIPGRSRPVDFDSFDELLAEVIPESRERAFLRRVLEIGLARDGIARAQADGKWPLGDLPHAEQRFRGFQSRMAEIFERGPAARLRGSRRKRRKDDHILDEHELRILRFALSDYRAEPEGEIVDLLGGCGVCFARSWMFLESNGNSRLEGAVSKVLTNQAQPSDDNADLVSGTVSGEWRRGAAIIRSTGTGPGEGPSAKSEEPSHAAPRTRDGLLDSLPPTVLDSLGGDVIRSTIDISPEGIEKVLALAASPKASSKVLKPRKPEGAGATPAPAAGATPAPAMLKRQAGGGVPPTKPEVAPETAAPKARSGGAVPPTKPQVAPETAAPKARSGGGVPPTKPQVAPEGAASKARSVGGVPPTKPEVAPEAAVLKTRSGGGVASTNPEVAPEAAVLKARSGGSVPPTKPEVAPEGAASKARSVGGVPPTKPEVAPEAAVLKTRSGGGVASTNPEVAPEAAVLKTRSGGALPTMKPEPTAEAAVLKTRSGGAGASTQPEPGPEPHVVDAEAAPIDDHACVDEPLATEPPGEATGVCTSGPQASDAETSTTPASLAAYDEGNESDEPASVSDDAEVGVVPLAYDDAEGSDEDQTEDDIRRHDDLCRRRAARRVVRSVIASVATAAAAAIAVYALLPSERSAPAEAGTRAPPAETFAYPPILPLIETEDAADDYASYIALADDQSELSPTSIGPAASEPLEPGAKTGETKIVPSPPRVELAAETTDAELRAREAELRARKAELEAIVDANWKIYVKKLERARAEKRRVTKKLIAWQRRAHRAEKEGRDARREVEEARLVVNLAEAAKAEAQQRHEAVLSSFSTLRGRPAPNSAAPDSSPFERELPKYLDRARRDGAPTTDKKCSPEGKGAQACDPE